MGEVRRIEDRHARQLEKGIAIRDVVGLLIVRHLARRDLPQRRRIGVRAKRAGRIHGALEFRAHAPDPATARSGDQRIVGQPRAQLLGDAGPQVARQHDAIGEQRIAARVDQGHVALRLHPVGVLVITEHVRQQTPLAARHFDIAGGGDHVRLGVVRDLVGEQQHRACAQIDGAQRRRSDQQCDHERGAVCRYPAPHDQPASTCSELGMPRCATTAASGPPVQ